MGPQRGLSEVGEVKPNGDAGNKEPAASPKTVDCSSLTVLFGVGIHGLLGCQNIKRIELP
jgi:hypothetical protein